MEEEKNPKNNEDEEELKERKKSKKPILFVAIIIIILLIVAVVLLLKYLPKQSNLECIGENSILVASKGCGYCKNQIEMLGDNKDNFNIIYCDEDEQFCIDNQIEGVPTWIINGEKVVGLQSIDKLKELTGC